MGQTLSQRLLPLLLLLLPLLLLTAASAESAMKQDQENDEQQQFTESQLAQAKGRLSDLFDASLDADKDGHVTGQELTAWLAHVANEQVDRDAAEAWRAYNVSEGGSLDWDAYASSRVPSEAAAAAADGEDGTGTASLRAEVKRAIEEASRETGLDRAGIKVGVPDLQPEDKRLLRDQEKRQAETGNRLAMELASDRRRWDAADADKDGRLSTHEYRDFAFAESAQRMRPTLAQEAVEKMDTNGDGRISMDEFIAEVWKPDEDEKEAGKAPQQQQQQPPDWVAEEKKNFKEVWDSNRDGYMDAGEMEKMLDQIDAAEGAHDELHAKEVEQLMRSADTDGDGRLSKAEVLASLPRFAGSAATNYGDSVGIHDEL